MQVELLSDKYKVHILTNKNVDEIYDLLSKNILYYEYCPPFVTRQTIQEDMRILPPGKVIEDKYPKIPFKLYTCLRCQPI